MERVQNVDGLRADALHLILMPTEKCNFRCSYCYETFELGRMPRWVIGGIRQIVTARAAELKRLDVSWFGGEPLLALSVIEQINSFCAYQSSLHGIQFKSDITTNGFLLTPDVQLQCLRLAISNYQISVDATRESHDARRRLANGNGTFDVVWNNLVAMKSLDRNFEVTIRCHFDRDNIQQGSQFVDMVATAFGGDPRFKVYLRDVSNLGGPGGQSYVAMSPEEYIEIDRLRRYARERGVAVIEPERGYVCYAAKWNSFVVRSNGRLSKCTVAFDNPRNDIGCITADGRFVVESDKVRYWTRGMESGDGQELSCPKEEIRVGKPRRTIPLIALARN